MYFVNLKSLGICVDMIKLQFGSLLRQKTHNWVSLCRGVLHHIRECDIKKPIEKTYEGRNSAIDKTDNNTAKLFCFDLGFFCSLLFLIYHWRETCFVANQGAENFLE